MKQFLWAMALALFTGNLWASTPVNYEFPDLKEVRDFRKNSVSGWSAVNDQVLMVSTSPKRKYLLVLTRPDRDLLFSHALAFTDTQGRVSARFDKVYAANANIRVPNTIKHIYEINGKAQAEATRLSVLAQACNQNKPESGACADYRKAAAESDATAK